MTEFTETAMRHYCRNLRCRSKLPAPVSNPREAFCARGCHSSFYLHRCLVCEGPLERKNETQKVCRKSKCRSSFRRCFDGGRYLPSSSARDGEKTLDSIDSKPALKAGRAWRIIAGPELTPTQLHCATVPDGDLGPDGIWKNSAWERIEAKNRAALAAHFDQLDAEAVANDFCKVCRRTDDLVDRRVIAADGYPPRGPDRWETICRECRAKRDAGHRAALIPIDPRYAIHPDLSIPDFLRRLLPRSERDYRLAA
jgi:hypothetical protein